MNKLIVPGLLVVLLALASCSNVKELLTIKPVIVEKPALIVPKTRPVKSELVSFIVITKDNMEEKFKELGKSEKDVVVFALTNDSYKALSLSVADLRRYIIQQNAVIKAYKEYYEPAKDNIKKK